MDIRDLAQKYLVILAFSAPALAQAVPQSVPEAISHDPIAVQGQPPASMDEVGLMSHGANMNAVIYLAAGAGPHPTLVILHGFPGYERNLDIAQAARRAGWNTFVFHYRGSWGSAGDFSFSHAVEDTDAALAFLRSPSITKKYRIDPAKIAIAGHSMGGYLALAAAAHDHRVIGVAAIAPWDIARDAQVAKKDRAAEIASLQSELRPLHGCTAESLLADIEHHLRQFEYVNLSPEIKDRPVLLIEPDDDTRPPSLELYAALKAAGARNAEQIQMQTDHGFSDHRIALEAVLLKWLARISK